MNRLAEKAIKSPKIYIWTTAIITIVIIILVALPMLTEKFANILHPLTIDTDPESMLAYDAPVRVTHRAKKKEFGVFDLMAIGVVNKTHKNGVFNKKTLNKVYDLATYAKSLQWKDKNNKTEGVLGVELISPSNVDNIEQGGPGTVKFNWLMPKPPTTEAEALEVFRKIQKQPILKGSLSSSDGQALALYIPLSSKHVSYKISALLKKRIASYDDEDEFFITGLAVAQDTFAIEMFQQMAITTPLAMILIFGLLWFFFRNITLVISPMIIAIVSAIVTMGLLIVTGNAIHILSSMIPIFIMPIAVLDAIHILSDFYDRYPQFKDRKKAIQFVMS
ncbi:MAG TPA: RND transporter, partial [Spirochaetes bacterium]|nr:RND transporter [Spirochaetota bacterium]